MFSFSLPSYFIQEFYSRLSNISDDLKRKTQMFSLFYLLNKKEKRYFNPEQTRNNCGRWRNGQQVTNYQTGKRESNIIYCLGAMRPRQPAYFEHVALSQRIKQFLITFKVYPCPNPNHAQGELCQDYHGVEDRRRNPYRGEGFLYWPSDVCGCQEEECPRCHNMYELVYHPLKYKTSKCYHYPCHYGLFCSSLHDHEGQLLQKYQFFRFELQTFKTELCPMREGPGHQLASCHYYHNDSDKRRNPAKVHYSHVQCSQSRCEDRLCPYAHNKIEQLYHPSRYKTKYCQSYINRKGCQYNEYCSFAHSDQEIKIELLHLMEKTQSFYDFKYKTVWCPYTNQHDRANCPYAHNFQDYRRDPKKKHYTPEICPNWNKGQIKSIQDSGCPLQMDCPKSHGWLQNKYHPDLKRWQSGQMESVESEKTNKNSIKSQSKARAYVLGAPFFKRDDKIDRSQSEAHKNGEKKESTSKNNKDKWFNFSFFLPEQETFSENNENQLCKTDVEAFWRLEKSRDRHYFNTSTLTKLKKRNRSYTKSLKQLLVRAGLEEKLSSIKINQVKLLSISGEELDKFGFNQQEKSLLTNTIGEYSKTHKLNMVTYTDSMVRFFRRKALQQTLDKLRKKGVSQNMLQGLSSSTINDLSFLEEEQKTCLPKILEEYADDRAFRELNTLIKQQTGRHSFNR